MLVVVLVGVNPTGGHWPVDTVVISGGGGSDQSVESPEVKASVGWGQPWSAPTREASKSTGRSEKRTAVKPRNGFPHENRSVGVVEVPRLSACVEGQCHW